MESGQMKSCTLPLPHELWPLTLDASGIASTVGCVGQGAVGGVVEGLPDVILVSILWDLGLSRGLPAADTVGSRYQRILDHRGCRNAGTRA